MVKIHLRVPPNNPDYNQTLEIEDAEVFGSFVGARWQLPFPGADGSDYATFRVSRVIGPVATPQEVFLDEMTQ